MENLNSLPLQVIILLCISIGATLLAIGVLVWFIGFEKTFDPGEFYVDKDDVSTYHSLHLPHLKCKVIYNTRGRSDLILFYFSLPHCLTDKEMSHLLKYVPQLSGFVFIEDAVSLQKSEDIFWGDIQHKILWFFFCKLYKEYGYEVKEEALEIGVT